MSRGKWSEMESVRERNRLWEALHVSTREISGEGEKKILTPWTCKHMSKRVTFYRFDVKIPKKREIMQSSWQNFSNEDKRWGRSRLRDNEGRTCAFEWENDWLMLKFSLNYSLVKQMKFSPVTHTHTSAFYDYASFIMPLLLLWVLVMEAILSFNAREFWCERDLCRVFVKKLFSKIVFMSIVAYNELLYFLYLENRAQCIVKPKGKKNLVIHFRIISCWHSKLNFT
jgi:hypothetical protein